MARHSVPRNKCKCIKCGWKGIRSDRIIRRNCPKCRTWATVRRLDDLERDAKDQIERELVVKLRKIIRRITIDEDNKMCLAIREAISRATEIHK